MVEATRGKDGKFTGSIGIGKTKIPTAMKSVLEPLVKKVEADDKAWWQDVRKPHESFEQSWEQYSQAIKDKKRQAWFDFEDIQKYMGPEGVVEAVQIVNNPYWAVQWLRMNGYNAQAQVSSIEITNRVYTPASLTITAPDGTSETILKDSWIIKADDGTFSVCDERTFIEEYKSMGVTVLACLHAEDIDWWDQLDVGKTIDGKFWVRYSYGDSRGDPWDYDWNPLNDLTTLHQMADGIHLFNEPKMLSHKAAFLAEVQGLNLR